MIYDIYTHLNIGIVYAQLHGDNNTRNRLYVNMRTLYVLNIFIHTYNHVMIIVSQQYESKPQNRLPSPPNLTTPADPKAMFRDF